MNYSVERQQKLHEYYLVNKDKWKVYRIGRTPEQRASALQQKVLWKENHPEVTLWSNAKYRAKKDGIDFDISIDDIIVPEYCPYLGIKLTAKKGNKHSDALMSLDRIDSTKGYVKGNVEVISYKANRMKNNATKDELLVFAKNVIKRNG